MRPASMKTKASKTRTDFRSACFFLAPNFVGFLVFVAFPVLFSLFMSFTNWNLSLHNQFREEPLQWVWFRNFGELVSQPTFWKYFGNTLFLMLGIPLGIAGSLFLAVLLSRKLKSNRAGVRWSLALFSLFTFAIIGLCLMSLGFGLIAFILSIVAGVILALCFTTGAIAYRTLFYLPSFTAGVAVFLLWKKLYNPINGPINSALRPILDSLAGVVNTTPDMLWLGAGYLFWAVALLGLLYFGFKILRGLFSRDFGLGTGLVSLAALFILALVLYGLGIVAKGLPAMAADGLEPPNWLTDVHWAKPAIMIMGLWFAIGSNNMLLYIAGISNIPPELYEASDIDGAGSWQKFWYITWPQLAPTTFFIVVMSFIGGLQGGFEQARAMTLGGPFGATTTLSYFVYTEGFEVGRLGYASAVAWVMFVMIFGLTIFNYKFGNRYIND